MAIKTEILKIKGGWDEVLDACRATVSKKFLNKEPSEEFKYNLIISEHSPIRTLLVKWRWEGLPSYIATHFARHHIGFEKWISTQRNDRQKKYDRELAPQNAPVTFVGEGNAQFFINLGKVRLCTTADPKTRQQTQDLKREMAEHGDKVIAWSMVPSCIYRGGCSELDGCDFYKKFLERHPEITVNTTIKERYDIYNKEFFGENAQKED